MSPEELPQQRVHEVITLPPRPSAFEGQCAFITPMPSTAAPKGSPRNATHLCSTEWASGGETRADAYYLNPRKTHWLLWIGFQDENSWNWKWTWSLYGYAPRRRIDETQAAIYLLMDAWRQESANWGLKRFDWINEEGLLSVADISAVSRAVWG